MFCCYQERSSRFNDYTNIDEEIIMCNETGKECPYSKLKKAQKRCQYVEPLEENNND